MFFFILVTIFLRFLNVFYSFWTFFTSMATTTSHSVGRAAATRTPSHNHHSISSCHIKGQRSLLTQPRPRNATLKTIIRTGTGTSERLNATLICKPIASQSRWSDRPIVMIRQTAPD